MITLKTDSISWMRMFDLLHLKKGNLPLVFQPVLQVKKGKPVKSLQRGQTSLVMAEILDTAWTEREGEGNVCMYNSSKDENRPIEYIKKFCNKAEQVEISWGDNFIRLRTDEDEVYFPKPHVDAETPEGWLTETPMQVVEVTNSHIKYLTKDEVEKTVDTVFFVNADAMVKAFDKAKWLGQRIYPMALEGDHLKLNLGDPKQRDKESGSPKVPINYVQGTFEAMYNDQLEHVFRNCDGEVKCYYMEYLWMHHEVEKLMKLDVVITHVTTEEAQDVRTGKDEEETD